LNFARAHFIFPIKEEENFVSAFCAIAQAEAWCQCFARTARHFPLKPPCRAVLAKTLVFNTELWLNSSRRKKSQWFLLIQWLFNKTERRHQAMARSPEEIKVRCSSIINNKELVSLVEKSSSPSAAYEMVFAETKDVSRAKAGRWLAVLRRDYPTEYRKLIPNHPSHVGNDKAQTEKERIS
jgi:hypothetical protein